MAMLSLSSGLLGHCLFEDLPGALKFSVDLCLHTAPEIKGPWLSTAPKEPTYVSKKSILVSMMWLSRGSSRELCASLCPRLLRKSETMSGQGPDLLILILAFSHQIITRIFIFKALANMAYASLGKCGPGWLGKKSRARQNSGNRTVWARAGKTQAHG